MSDAIIVAAISFVGTVIGSLAGVIAAGKLTAYRLEQLEKKVDKHNTVIERTYRLESEVDTIKEQIKGGAKA